MLKQKIKNLNKFNKLAAVVAISVLLVAGAYGGLKTVKADATCSTISDCQQQINNNNNAVAQLQNQATSYQNAIDQLQGQINQLEVVINSNLAEQTDLQNRITAAQAQLDQERKTLGENIKAMYLEGNVSMLEILASSKNLSQYVDKQQYRNAVSDKVKSSVDTINNLKAQLLAQQKQLQGLIDSEQSQKNQLASAQYQQQSMLNYNQSQQDAFNAQTADNQKKLNALIAAQRTSNASSVGGYYFIHFPGAITADPINGSYPYSNWPFSMSLGGCTTDGPDQWGYCTRQCVSYAAWAVAYSGRAAPLYWGNAADWVGAAKANGIPFDSYPEPGDVAISTAGYWGHAMYVEAVSGNQIYVSQYNQQLTGEFSTQWRTFQ